MRILMAACVFAVSASVFAADYKGIPIAPELNTPAYDRDDYKHWIDEDGDSQDTRQEILIAESLIPVTFDSDGIVSGGLWAGPYCGFVATLPSQVQIDHMIPLKEVHVSGGHSWDAAKRQAYANDLSDSKTLIAVKGGCNQSKGAKDPADWLPPNRAYWCTYLDEWVAIKLKWGLSMDQDEVDAVKEGFRVCKKYKAGDKLEGRH